MTSPTDHSGADEPTWIEPLRGWRLWRVVPVKRSQYRLAAWSDAALEWPAREPCEGRCLVISDPGHVAPQLRCRCGLYAFRSRSLAEAALTAQMRPATVALGAVSLWGRVVEHSFGWRGQYGYPYELLIVGDAPGAARELGAAYAVDVDRLDVPELMRRARAERRRAYEDRMGRSLAA